MFALRRQSTGSEFLPNEQQRIVAISCVLRSRDGLAVWSLGDLNSTEGELVERFFDGIERYSPDLVFLERLGLRPPRIDVARARCRRAGAALLGNGR